ncbi:MAG: S9 family peptidase [Deltaproteobacteria bacterium]|nr:S9 family peptidase [Deltaproteobacteria bacterium]
MPAPMVNSRRALALLALAGALLARPAAAADESVPLQAFFGKPEIGEVSLSPSGRWLAVTVPGKNDRMELRVADLDQQPWKWRTVAWLKDYDVAGVDWVNDRRLVFQARDSQAADVWSGTRGLWAVDADGENGKLLVDAEYYGFRLRTTRDKNVLGGEWTLAGTLPGDGNEVLVAEPRWSAVRKAFWWSLARLDTRAPAPIRLTTGAPDGAQRWITDEWGQPRYMEAHLDGRARVYRKTAEGEWESLLDVPDLSGKGWSPRFLHDGKLFVAVQPEGATAVLLTTFDPETRTLAERPVLAAKGFDVGESAYPLVDQDGDRLLGWRYRLDTLYTRWFDERMQRFQAGLDRALPGRANLISCSRCQSAKRWLVTSLSDREPPSHGIFEPGTGRFTPVGSAHPDIPAERTGRRTLERIKARDGLELPLYVTRPAGVPAAPEKPLPAVVYVHGGPWTRVGLEWSGDPVPQFLASRGYVVLEPEFRGSSGYGLAHERAGRQQWGLAMQDDLVDAVRWAAEKGLVDRGRVCIMGASYGGYAALLGPVRDPAAYRCAVSWVGVTELPRLIRDGLEEEAGAGFLGRLLVGRVGDPVKDAERLKRTSPVHRAAEIRVPVLAAWGKEDRRVPLEQGRLFRDAAREAGVELEYVEYADEGHSWLRTETWLDFMRRTEKLLERTIGSRR